MAAPNQGFIKVDPLGQKMVHVIEHQNAVLGHDPDADDCAQKADDVQGRASEPKRQNRPQQGEHTSKNNGDRLVIGAKLDQ